MQRVVCHVVRRDSSSIKCDRVRITFSFVLFDWLKRLTYKEGRRPEYPEKTPEDQLQKMPHTKARKFKPQPKLEPAL